MGCKTLWCKTIGTKAMADDKKADYACIIRTVWVGMHIITCIAIIANAAHQW
jgi:hypothetical protein